MNFDSLRKHCATLPGATMDVKWGADECYCVATKMFAVFFVDGGKGAEPCRSNAIPSVSSS